MQLFFFAAATVTAQNIKLNDFEDGAADSWASWQGGASVEVVDNPSATEPNTSSKALKLTPEKAWGSIAKWMGDGFLTKESAKISVLVYSTDAENEIKIYLENGGAGEEKIETETFKPVAQNTWTASNSTWREMSIGQNTSNWLFSPKRQASFTSTTSP